MSYEHGDPFIEWNEEISAREDFAENTEEELMNEFMDVLKDKVIQILVTEFDFSMDEAEETVTKSMQSSSSIWHEEATPEELAKYLANDDDDE